MDRNSTVKSRFEILKTVYRQCGGKAGEFVVFHPRQIENAFFTDVQFDLKIMKEKGFLDFKGNFATHRFQIALTPAGASLVEDAFRSMKLEADEKDAFLDSVLEKLKI